MDYTEYTTVKNKFAATPNLCDLFKLLSIETWKRMEHAYLKRGMKVFETTITQNLIFTINAFNEQYNLNIDIFEALDERTNGNDFELIIRFPNANVEFYAPVQSKKVYRDGRYVSMNHGGQIQSLIDYAKANDAKPFYLLYNVTSEPIPNAVLFSNPLELTGCTLIPADYLYTSYYNAKTKKDGNLAWKIPYFDDLNPHIAFPWHKLVCPDNPEELLKFLKPADLDAKNLKIEDVVNQNKDLKLGFYPINSTPTKEKWENIKDLTVPSKEKNQNEIFRTEKRIKAHEDFIAGELEKGTGVGKNKNLSTVYSPKSRIIISK